MSDPLRWLVGPVGRKREEVLWLFVIYRHPSDFPKHYVVRPWAVPCGRSPLPRGDWPHMMGCLCSSLEEARATAQYWADVRIPRHELEDPKIVETWL